MKIFSGTRRAASGVVLGLIVLGSAGCQAPGRTGCATCGTGMGASGALAPPYESAGAAEGAIPSGMGHYSGGAGVLAGHHMRNHRGPQSHMGPEPGPVAGPPSPTVAYPYYTTRGPRDFLASPPAGIGR